jgi:hypothetical protein
MVANLGDHFLGYFAEAGKRTASKVGSGASNTVESAEDTVDEVRRDLCSGVLSAGQLLIDSGKVLPAVVKQSLT